MLRHILLLLVIGVAGFLQAQTTPPAPPTELSLWVSRDVSPSSKVRLHINTRNIPVVKVEAYRINGLEWLKQIHTEKEPPVAPGRPTRTWDVTVADKNQRTNSRDNYFSRQVNLPTLAPGVYTLRVTGGGRERRVAVNVTNLAVVLKRSPKKALVWVTHFQTGKVLPGALVRVFDESGRQRAEGRTNPEGYLQVPLSPGNDVFVIQHNADMAGLTSSAQSPDGKLKAHFQTDRPIYRPGQLVFFKAVLRLTKGQGYDAVANRSVTVRIRDPRDNPLEELTLQTNANGSIAGEYRLPVEAMTGAYTLEVRLGSQSQYQTFTVAEYRKPEFKVEVKPGQSRYLAGQPLTFEVDVQYYFGAPVPQAEVSYTVRRSPLRLGGSSEYDEWFYSGDGNLYPSDTYGSSPYVADDTVYTDASGKALITVDTDPTAPDSVYSITLTVTDNARRQVNGSSAVNVFAAQLRLGLSSELQYANAGALIPVDLKVTDLDGQPKPATVQLRVLQPKWNEKEGRYQSIELTKTSVNVPPSGNLKTNLPAKAAGTLVIEASAPDGSGRTARTSMSMWVAGAFDPKASQEEEPEITIRTDKRTYTPGETIQANVSTNNPSRPILLVAEGEDLWKVAVVQASKGSHNWTVPTSAAMSPNIYITAVQWVDGQTVSSNSLAPIPDPKRQINVRVVPDRQEYSPGDKATFNITTTDVAGKPVATELSLGVVDEAIYALMADVTQDPYKLFWGTRSNLVVTSVSAPEELSGGAYQRVDSVAPVRQRFEDTAFWNPTVVTGADGKASVTFEMPGNLTTWRTTARAITPTTSVGTERMFVTATRPLTLRLATPRQLVHGDRVGVIGTLNNRTDRPLTVKIDIESVGLQIIDPTQRSVTIPAKSQAQVDWEVVASDLPPTGRATITARATPEDGVGPEAGDALQVSVPIVPKGVPLTLLAGGVLTQDAVETVHIPGDAILPPSRMIVEIRAGLSPLRQSAIDDVLKGSRYGTLAAAYQLEVAAASGLTSDSDAAKEALALLSRTQAAGGWGWWEGAPVDPVITAEVLWSLAVAKEANIRVFDSLLAAASGAAQSLYARTNLWEHRALLAASLLRAGHRNGEKNVEEVRERGQNLSPFASFRLAEALAVRGSTEAARSVAAAPLQSASVAPTTAYVPVGGGIGWSASEITTNAQALATLTRLGDPLAEKFARWLGDPDQTQRLWQAEKAAIAQALTPYLAKHPEPQELGPLTVRLNGQPVEVSPVRLQPAATATARGNLLRAGENTIEIQKSGPGELAYTVRTETFLPGMQETVRGVRVLRRFEVMGPTGVWEEVDRVIRPNEPVRVTVVVWGDDLSDALKVTEPIPAGFEYVEDEMGSAMRQEVRDGAILHYLVNSGAPRTIRYFLRAESDGVLTALPASAEYLRRPLEKGQTQGGTLEVRKG